MIAYAIRVSVGARAHHTEIDMSQRLKNTLAFTNLAAGASVALPHGLVTSVGRPLAPDIIYVPSPNLAVTDSDELSVTLRNAGPTALTGNLLVEAWHTIERSFGDVNDENLPHKPFVVVSTEANGEPPQPPYPVPNVELFIYARSSGSDASGDGTLANPYRTFQRAIRDVPSVIPAGVFYTVDITGIGAETLPADYQLPPFVMPGRNLLINADLTVLETVPNGDITLVAADPVTQLIEITFGTARPAWAGDALKGKILNEIGDDFSACAIAGSDATHLYLCTAYPGVGSTGDLTINEPSATLNPETVLRITSASNLTINGVKFESLIPSPFVPAVVYGFANVPVFFQCDVAGTAAAKIGPNYVFQASVLRNRFILFDEASFSAFTCLLLNVPLIRSFGPPGAVFQEDVFDGCAPIADLPPYNAFFPYTGAPESLSAGANFPAGDWAVGYCFFKNGIPDPDFGAGGQIWALNGTRMNLLSVKVDNAPGDAIRVEGAPSLVVMKNIDSGGSLPVNAGYGVNLVDGGAVRVLDDATEISGALGDMKVGSLPTRTWANFRAVAPIKNEYDIASPPVGDEALNGPTTGARLYQRDAS